MKIPVGSTVTDEFNRMLGVVIARSDFYENRVIVRAWSPLYTRYTEFPIREDKLIVIDDKKVFGTINEDDREIGKGYEHEALNVALLTADKTWFLELTKQRPDLKKDE